MRAVDDVRYGSIKYKNQKGIAQMTANENKPDRPDSKPDVPEPKPAPKPQPQDEPTQPPSQDPGTGHVNPPGR